MFPYETGKVAYFEHLYLERLITRQHLQWACDSLSRWLAQENYGKLRVSLEKR
jgi:hypothetical protein